MLAPVSSTLEEALCKSLTEWMICHQLMQCKGSVICSEKINDESNTMKSVGCKVVNTGLKYTVCSGTSFQCLGFI